MHFLKRETPVVRNTNEVTSVVIKMTVSLPGGIIYIHKKLMGACLNLISTESTN